jgi:hypothetical protein
VLVAQEPLSLLHLSAITNPTPAIGQSIEEAVANQVSFCNHILEADTAGIVTFCHATVQDFLLSTCGQPTGIPREFIFDLERLHLEMADVCCRVIEELLFDPQTSDNFKTAVLKIAVLQAIRSKLPDSSPATIFCHTSLLEYALLRLPTHVRSLNAFVFKQILGRRIWQNWHQNAGTPDMPPMVDYCCFAKFLVTTQSTYDFHRVPEFAVGHKITGIITYLMSECKSAEERKKLVNRSGMDSRGITLLMLSCYSRHLGMVEVLIENGAAINVQDWLGETALMVACEKGEESRVSLLLEAGADPNVQSFHETIEVLPSSSTPAAGAFQLGNGAALAATRERINSKFTEHDGPIRVQRDEISLKGQMAAHCAITEGYSGCVEHLIQHGANFSEFDSTGQSPMHLAIALGYTEIQQLILPLLPDASKKDAWGRTLIHHIACSPFLIETRAYWGPKPSLSNSYPSSASADSEGPVLL